MDVEVTARLRGRKLQAWQFLMSAAGLTVQEPPEQTVLVWDGLHLAAAGSRQGAILKYLAVAPAFQGQGLLAAVVTALRQQAFASGCPHLFLYTKPEHLQQFSSLFFYPVARTQHVLLMESQKDGLQTFLDTLPAVPKAGTVGSIVMNCDPFTLGHLHLIETAAKECDQVLVFAVSEDRGRFSAGDRLEMLRRGTAHLSNVAVMPTGPYLISQATFPTYFLKDRDQSEAVHCGLDIEIFASCFAPRFHITRRYAGTEPLSRLTNSYNQALQTLLPARGIDFREVPRLEQAGQPVSASQVRSLLDAGAFEAAARLLPETIVHYLQTLCKEEIL